MMFIRRILPMLVDQNWLVSGCPGREVKSLDLFGKMFS
jgi:hypothetical protein